jgi:CDP-diacylglycerol--serine O-phosphatidyltransferase
VCGVVAILQIGMGLAKGGDGAALNFQRAAWFILGGMIFDALDGFVARLTKTASSFGAQLDSLCDLITFGVAPAFLVFAQTQNIRGFWERPIQVACVLYAMCALIRLARFTVETAPDESSHREFAGLPSPAAAGVLASAVLPGRQLDKIAPELATDIIAMVSSALPGLTLACAILMVSRIKYPHLINRLLRGRRPFVTLVELSLVAALVVIFREFAFFLGFFGYAAMGPGLWLRKRLSRRPAASGPPSPAPSPREEKLF